MKKNLVVFVHGLGANGHDWWGSTKNLFNSDPIIKKDNDVIFFEYKTEKVSTIVNHLKNKVGLGEVLASLDELGNQLATYLYLNAKEYYNIKLFGHSMGGIVISSALPIINRTYNSIYKSISSVAFCGTPLGGSNLSTFLSKWLGFILSDQTKSLEVDSPELTNITNLLPAFVSPDTTEEGKIFLQFFNIANDEVVISNEEKFGIFITYKNNTKINELPITGKHSDSLKNLSATCQNYKVISKWILEKINSARETEPTQETTNKNLEMIISKVIDDKLGNIFSKKFFNSLNLESKMKIAKKIENSEPRIKFNVSPELNIIFKKLKEKHKNQLNRNHIVRKREIKKTYLLNGKVIEDFHQEIEIMAEGDTFIHYFYGFNNDVDKYSNKTFIENVFMKELLERNKKLTNQQFKPAEIDRFNSSIYVAKKKSENDNHSCNLEPTSVSYYEIDDSKGLLFKFNLGSNYVVGEIVHFNISCTAPTDIDLTKQNDTMDFLSPSAETYITIQEEIFGSSNYKYQPTFLVNNSVADEKNGFYIEKTHDLYYRRHSCKFFYDTINENIQGVTIRVEKIK